MIVVRNIHRAKYGMGNALVKLTKEMFDLLGRDRRVSGVRIVTDVSGTMFTVESEFQVASLAVFEQVHAELLQGAEFAKWFARIQPLIDEGRREFYTVQG